MIEPVSQGHSIAMVGAWNPRIFGVPWVAANLANSPNIEIAVVPSDPAIPMRLRFDGVYLHAGFDRVLLTPVQLNDPSLQRMQEVAQKVLELLPHTPITGIGINVQYVEATPRSVLLAAFAHGDNDALGDAGARIVSTTIRRSLVHNDRNFNLILDQKPNGSVTLELNFHRDVSSPAVARDHLAVGFLNYRDAAIDFIGAVYSSQVIGADA
ncbi:MAG: hypothetical protein IT353_04790 [Gemmatimonadaceae bacterium]|nr:hypothetical protein [Gemmatimonadaceae bacterium]